MTPQSISVYLEGSYLIILMKLEGVGHDQVHTNL